MLRLILGLIAGVLAGGIIVGVVETLSHVIFPPPPGLDVSDPAQLRSVMDQISLEAKIAVLVAWAGGTFAGGWVAAFIARRGQWPAWIVAAVLFGGSVWSMTMIPHPLWMIAGAVIVSIVFAWLGGRLGARNLA